MIEKPKETTLRKEIYQFDTKQTAKVVTICMGITVGFISLLGMIFSIISYAATPKSYMLDNGQFFHDQSFAYRGSLVTSIITFILIPILYVIFGYIMTRISLWIYNKIAGKYGGIAFYTNDHKQIDSIPKMDD